MSSGFTCVVACIRFPFLFIAEYFIVYINTTFYLSGNLGLSPPFFLTIMNKGMMNIDVECLSPCFWLFSFGSRSRSYGNSVLNFLRKFCTFFSHRLQPVMHKHSSSPLLDNTCYFVGFLFFLFW